MPTTYRTSPALFLAALLALTGCGNASDGASDDDGVVTDALAEASTAMPDGAGHDLPPSTIAEGVTPESLVLPPQPTPNVPELPAGVDVRAMTWNLYGGRWATLDEQAEVLAASGADLVGLQECPDGAAATLAELAGFAHWAQSTDNALLSKTPLADVADVSLGSEGRAALHATTSIGGATFSVYAAHVSWNVAGNLQCRQFTTVLAADPVPRLVVVGDFNDEPHSTQIDALEAVVADAFTTAGIYPGQLVSWPSHWFDETEGAQLIDLVFFRRAFPALVLDAGVSELMPPRSDHKPAWADLLYPAEGAPAFDDDPLAASRDPFRVLPPEGLRPPNLLTNPGAEEGLEGWSVEGDPRAEPAREQRWPHGGAAFFTGYPKAIGKTMRSTGSQVIDLGPHAATIDARRGVLYASAWLATGYLTVVEGDEVSNLCKPYDDAEVVVQALGAAGEVLVERASGRRDTLAWLPWAAAVDLPPGTRAARVTFAMNRKVQSGPGNDGAVDDLYLGYADLDEPHARLGGDVVRNGGAETLDTAGWVATDDAQAFPNDTLMGPWGGTLFPPWAWSGRGFFAASAASDDGAPGGGLAQELDLSPWAADQAAGTLALRWGGWSRTFESRTTWTLGLVLDDDGPGEWGYVSAPPVFAASWTGVEALTRIPPGATHVRLVWTGPEASGSIDAGFVDGVFAWPEVVAPPTP